MFSSILRNGKGATSSRSSGSSGGGTGSSLTPRAGVGGGRSGSISAASTSNSASNNNGSSIMGIGTNDHPIVSALVVVIGVLLILPGLFSYFVLTRALAEQNVCHVGPVVGMMSSPSSSGTTPPELLQLYGTYTTFDDASYYFIKTPYPIQPACLPSFGWWSITTLSLTLLSPRVDWDRQQEWRRSVLVTSSASSLSSAGRMGNILDNHRRTSPSITWDQSHKLPTPVQTDASSSSSSRRNHYQEQQHSSHSNRWCCLNQPDLSHYANNQDGRAVQPDFAHYQQQSSSQEATLGSPEVAFQQQQQKELFRICADPQASILSSGDQAPFFVELPLHPPSTGVWNTYEPAVPHMDTPFGTNFGQFQLMSRGRNTDDDVQDLGKFGSSNNKGGGLYGEMLRKRRKRQRRFNEHPYQIQVQCHVRDMPLKNLAHGTLMDMEEDEFMGRPQQEQPFEDDDQMSSSSTSPTTTMMDLETYYTSSYVLDLSATWLLIAIMIISRTCGRNKYNAHVSGQDWVSIWQQQWQSSRTWWMLGWHVVWMWMLGWGLEPLLGSLTFFSIVISMGVLLAALAAAFPRPSSTAPSLSSSASVSSAVSLGVTLPWTIAGAVEADMTWILFGLSVLLAQLSPSTNDYDEQLVDPDTPSLAIGFLELSSIRLGEYDYALQLNVLNVLIWIYPIMENHTIISHWRLLLWTITVGYWIQFSLVQEVLCAPQWTIPTMLLGHLWWKLQQLHYHNTNRKKRDHAIEEEMEALVEEGDEEDWESDDDDDDDDHNHMNKNKNTFGPDDISELLTVPEPTLKQRIILWVQAVAFWAFFGSWFILTLICAVAFDWTLVIGHLMVLCLAVGTQQFPKHPLWSLYHMFGASTLIVWNVMTLVGWSFTQVAITTHALHALDAPLVWSSLILQTIVHFVVLLHTVQTKYWSTSGHVPFAFFWNNLKTVGDELRMWMMLAS